jgi:hypothetical protein
VSGDSIKDAFDEITADVVAQLTAEKVSSATAAKEVPLPPSVAEVNREQIAAGRGVIVGVSITALAALVIWVLVLIAKVIG